MSNFINFRIGNFNLNMKLKLPFLIFYCLVLSSLEIYSQNCSYNFNGIVVDLHDESPLSNAVISIDGLDQNILSDEKRFFSICWTLSRKLQHNNFSSKM